MRCGYNFKKMIEIHHFYNKFTTLLQQPSHMGWVPHTVRVIPCEKAVLNLL
jgi:hypothetical protein